LYQSNPHEQEENVETVEVMTGIQSKPKTGHRNQEKKSHQSTSEWRSGIQSGTRQENPNAKSLSALPNKQKEIKKNSQRMDDMIVCYLKKRTIANDVDADANESQSMQTQREPLLFPPIYE